MGKTHQTREGQPAKYMSADPTIADGDGAALRVNEKGELVNAPGSSTYNEEVPVITSGDSASAQSDARGNQKVTLGAKIAGETFAEDFIDAHGDFEYTRITADTLIRQGTGLVSGVIVASHSSGTLKLWDNEAASGNILMNTYTFASGSQVVSFPEPIRFNEALFADIGGTVDLTIIWKGAY